MTTDVFTISPDFLWSYSSAISYVPVVFISWGQTSCKAVLPIYELGAVSLAPDVSKESFNFIFKGQAV